MLPRSLKAHVHNSQLSLLIVIMHPHVVCIFILKIFFNLILFKYLKNIKLKNNYYKLKKKKKYIFYIFNDLWLLYIKNLKALNFFKLNNSSQFFNNGIINNEIFKKEKNQLYFV